MITSPAPLEWLQTLADATRVRLLRLLDREELSVSELCNIVQLPQSTVSRHLKVLISEVWIGNRRVANNQLYRVDRSVWNDARCDLWSWVESQAADSPTSQLDDARLKQVLAERSTSDAFFRSSADRWDAVRVELFGSRLDAFALAAAIPEQAVVAELGCGSAPLAQLIAPFASEVIAVDSSAAMLSAAQRQSADKKNIRVLAGELSALPIDAERLDLAWLVLVLPYVEQPISILTEAARVLKPNAKLIIVDLLPHDREPYRAEMGHVRLGIDEAELNGWCRASGLHVQRFCPLPPDSSARGPALFTAVCVRETPSSIDSIDSPD
ncbi:MAG: metalloregulator ArsR/SmtB family transcription factor [Pirellulales bacterium]